MAIRSSGRRHTTMTELRIVTLEFAATEMVLERWTHPKLSRRTCTCECGLHSCRGESAGVAKRSRERSSALKSLPSRFASFCIAVCQRGEVEGGTLRRRDHCRSR
jgi:hypothetical protein